MQDAGSQEEFSLSSRRSWSPILCIAVRGLSMLCAQIVSVAVGWQIYDTTQNAFLLGLVGLIQFLPGLFLVLLTGAVSDRYDRRHVIIITNVLETMVVLGLAVLALSAEVDVAIMLAMLFVFAIARAFLAPAVMSLLPSLVSRHQLPRMIAISSSVAQSAMVAGPVMGGLLYTIAPSAPYLAAAVCCVLAIALTILIIRPQPQSGATLDSRNMLAGFLAIWKDKVLLGAISLDMFAVLLGGVVVLMPIFARDILDVGPTGLGLLRGTAAGGAICMALFLSFWPIRKRSGIVMLITTAIFGLAITAFGLSTNFILSLFALLVMGAADMISVYIRNTLVQLNTPDWLRGRVNAVNLVFLGASNELGGFRAGVMAALLGAVPAVALGGLAATVIAGLWAVLFPQLRQMEELGRKQEM